MFKIEMCLNGNRTYAVREWMLGEPKPEDYCAEYIKIFTASDKELRYILQMFRGLPNVSHKDSITWRGDYAQFIFDNL